MSWIEEIPPEKAEGKLQELYQTIIKKRGKIANILKVHSLFPESLACHLDLYMTLMFGPGNLSRKERELIAVAVSWQNRCAYCLSHHGEALAHYLKDGEKLNRILKDPRQDFLSPREKALVNFSLTLTKSPCKCREEDITALKRCGLRDRDILHLVLIIGYFNFVNRVALGLGVNFDEEEISGYKI